MKKIFLALMAGALFASCNEDFDDWAQPQGFEPEESQLVKFSATAGAESYDLAAIEEENIQLFNPSLQMPAGFTLQSYTAKLVNRVTDGEGTVSEEGATAIAVTNEGQAAKADVQDVVTDFFGKRPDARSLDLDVYARVVSADGKTIVKSQTVQIPIVVTPTAPVISSAYYLVGDMCGWDNDHKLAFSHSDADVYEDPVFTLVFETTADNQYWKIIPQDNIDSDNFWANPGVVGTAVDGDVALEGSLINKDAQAGKIETAGKYRMTINMMDYTYKIEPILFNEFVYFIGATDGWSAADQKLALANDNGLYKGYVYCADPNGWGVEFKFQRVAGSWDNEINTGTFTGGITGDFEGTDGGNIKASKGVGVYYVEMDLGNLTLKATFVEKMGVIGDFNSWGGDAEMSWNDQDFCYELSMPAPIEGGWKFRVNSDWALNLGGELTNLVQDGANITTSGSIIKLYPTRKTSDNIYCTVQ